MESSRRERPVWPVIALLVFILLMFAAILFPVFAQQENRRPPRVLSVMKQLGLSMLMYAADHDGKLPLAENWMDAIREYHKNDSLIHDPELQNPGPTKYGFAFYQPLSGVDLDTIENPDVVPMIFQSRLLYRNASGDLRDVRKWDDESHGAYVAFAGGHATYLSPEALEKPIEIKFKPKD